MLKGMTETAIEVRGLRKSYGSLEAVKGVDLQVDRGEVFALLGPNGAGKTTIVEILEGYRKRSAGEVSVLGNDPARNERSFKQRIGIVLQETGVERFLTVEEVVEQFRGFYPSPRPLDEAIAVVGLDDKRKELVRRLSGGQQRRLDVAIGLAGDPELLFLDEPTTGFDPGARRSAWEMVKNLQDLGKTIFLTTHYMDEAQNLADRVAIIAAGEIVAEGPPRTLAGREETQTTISFSLPAGAESPSAQIGGRFELVDGSWRTQTKKPTTLLHDLTGWALGRGIELQELNVSQPTLEDIYLALTGARDTDKDTPPKRRRSRQ
jgi:ABC-2 type transport system ATP-binding protein